MLNKSMEIVRRELELHKLQLSKRVRGNRKGETMKFLCVRSSNRHNREVYMASKFLNHIRKSAYYRKSEKIGDKDCKCDKKLSYNLSGESLQAPSTVVSKFDSAGRQTSSKLVSHKCSASI